jgi:mRNA-degrading endonuclease HigB of HigAB toxin-antitoxin module
VGDLLDYFTAQRRVAQVTVNVKVRGGWLVLQSFDAGQDFHLTVKFRHAKETVYVKGVYTHAEYDKDKWKYECNC